MSTADPSKPKRPMDSDVSNNLTTPELLDLFGDEYTRTVLRLVAEQPRSGREVAEAADISRATAYRRLNDLRDAGLVRSEMQIQTDGHHREQFEAVDVSFAIALDENGLEARRRETDGSRR
nr:winged helix-turn-helix domain-containing protein [Halapricum desulfuricans]